MKKILIILLVFINLISYSQNIKNKEWLVLKDNDLKHFTVTKKTKSFTIDEFRFDVIWDDKLFYSDNIGYYGGIKTLKIFKKNLLINTIEKIEDVIALGEIGISFFDYNMDGYIDFSLPIDSGKVIWSKYYLYDIEQKKYKHIEDWDYIRIQKLNKKTKQFVTILDGNADESEQELYQVSGFELVLLKTIKHKSIKITN
ncbi:hypothetical protein [Lutibacter sp.]|uniref:XAC2610-related protein n=1 Tax=Lutibacter sp. TaxID=1925666 RepID=UPI0027330301|nr:hypothetical protein [Lutibacter sp.]MDP3314382.1 hypothetical protein [Lutibacter sp.]